MSALLRVKLPICGRAPCASRSLQPLGRLRQTLRQPQLRWQSDNPSSASVSKTKLKTAQTTEPSNKTTSNTSAAASTVAKASVWTRFGPLSRGVEAYGRSMRKRPYITQVATAFVIFLCSDLSAQYISGKEYDPVRTCRTVAIGLVAAIPQFNWFLYLSRNFNYSSLAVSVAVKVVINQFCFTPVFLTYFFGAQALLSGDSLHEAYNRLLITLPTSWKNAWKVWPAAMAINFAFVPLYYRSVVGGLVAVGWQTYLSFVNRQAELLEARNAALVEAADPSAPLQFKKETAVV